MAKKAKKKLKPAPHPEPEPSLGKVPRYKGISKEEGRFHAKSRAGMIREFDEKDERDTHEYFDGTKTPLKTVPHRAGRYTEKKRAGVEVEPGTFKKPKGTQFVEIVMATPKKHPRLSQLQKSACVASAVANS